MNFFNYRDDELYAENVSVRSIAKKVGTPCYLYSYRTIERHFRVFEEPFKDVPHVVCYSVKANSNLSLLRLLSSWGSGMDVVSGGELKRALKVGCDHKKIVFSGVGKSKEEIQLALESDILMLNVESREELDLINATAREMNMKAPIALRVNPDIDAKTHPHITTGLRKNKFGIGFDQAYAEYRYAMKLLHVEIVGMDCHIGSQLTELAPLVAAAQKLKELICALRKYDLHIQYLDVGGGLGITYNAEEPPHPTEYGKAILDVLKDLNVTLVFEPGRVIMGNAGILVTEVQFTKKTPDREFLIVDAGMNDLIRPALYNAYQKILPIVQASGQGHGKVKTYDVVGPICESGDFLGRERELPHLKRGDLVAVMSSGAYGFSMASNYNTRPKIAEVLVRDDEFHIIRERETFEDLIKHEKMLEL